MAAVQFRVLGPLEVRRGETAVGIGSRRQRMLLARLVLDAGRVVPLDALCEALWGDRPPADPRNAVQTYIARLREHLGPDAPIATRPPGYALEVSPQQVDALRFEQLLAEAQRHRGDDAVVRARLDEALGLWRGPAYPELADGAAHAEALRLAERRRIAVEERAAARLALGEAADLVGELSAAVAAEPLRERLVALLMEALAAAGRQREALAVYRQHRERLAEEAGLSPTPALRALEARILRGEPGGELGGEPGRERSRAAEPVPGASAVPALPTSLVGRAAELADVRELLHRQRLVTLTGPGGVGKTRIAAEVAREAERDGTEVAWAELAPVGDPAALPHVLAAAVGVDLAGGLPPADALLGALASRRLLLVLDNCEHVLGEVAALVEQLERRCPAVRVLATSRERLAVDGEWVRPLPPLAVGAAADGAEAGAAALLFAERAAAAGVRLDLPDQLPLITEICRCVDGLPLAVELAAARAGALGLDDLLATLRADGAAAGRRRGGTARHHDLWAVAAWSHRLLTGEEQRLFERLGVFAGAFGVEEAHAVAAPAGQSRADTVEQLAALVESSVLSRTGRGRYRMLRTLRAFARQRLADRGELRAFTDRHARALTAAAEHAAGPPLSAAGRRWLEAALDDLRAVRQHVSRAGDTALLGRLLAALYRFDYWRPGAELLGWADDALGLDGMDDEPTAPQVHAAAAAAAWRRGDLQRARRLAAGGLDLGDPDDPAMAVLYEAVGDVATFQGRLADAEAAFRAEARLARRGGDPDGEVLGRASTALVLAYAGRLPEGIAEADAAFDAAARAGPAARAFARYAQGECRAERAPAEAVALLDDAAALAADGGAAFTEGVARLTATSLRGRHGPARDALPFFADVIDRWERSGNWTQQWTTLRNLVELLVRLGAAEPAVRIAAAAEAEQTAGPTFGTESDRLGRALANARCRLGEERFAAARAQGAGSTGPQTVALALATIADLTASVPP